VCLLYFSVNCVFYAFLQYFDTVGLVFWPVKTVARIINLYCVGGEVKPCSINQCDYKTTMSTLLMRKTCQQHARMCLQESYEGCRVDWRVTQLIWQSTESHWASDWECQTCWADVMELACIAADMPLCRCIQAHIHTNGTSHHVRNYVDDDSNDSKRDVIKTRTPRGWDDRWEIRHAISEKSHFYCTWTWLNDSHMALIFTVLQPRVLIILYLYCRPTWLCLHIFSVFDV